MRLGYGMGYAIEYSRHKGFAPIAQSSPPARGRVWKSNRDVTEFFLETRPYRSFPHNSNRRDRFFALFRPPPQHDLNLPSFCPISATHR